MESQGQLPLQAGGSSALGGGADEECGSLLQVRPVKLFFRLSLGICCEENLLTMFLQPLLRQRRESREREFSRAAAAAAAAASISAAVAAEHTEQHTELRTEGHDSSSSVSSSSRSQLAL
jgi:hypothetical protein